MTSLTPSISNVDSILLSSHSILPTFILALVHISGFRLLRPDCFSLKLSTTSLLKTVTRGRSLCDQITRENDLKMYSTLMHFFLI
jgi:hypothetical protein